MIDVLRGGGAACHTRPRALATQGMGIEDTDAEAALLQRYGAGDATAARLLSSRLLPRIFAHAMRVLNDPAEAEDVAQDAMMRLWKVAPDWRTGEAKVTTWLYRVTANLCTDRLRKRRATPLEDIAEPADPSPSAVARIQTASRTAALQDALQALPDRQRQAVILRHIDGLANPEIAAILDVGVEAVESLTARGKRALSLALRDQRAALGFEGE